MSRAATFYIELTTVGADQQIRRVRRQLATLNRRRPDPAPPAGCGWRHRKGQATR